MFASSAQIVEQLEGKIREINHQMQEAREDVKLYELEQLEAEHAEETCCSLRFGERMSVVRNSPTVVVNSDADTSRTAEWARRQLAAVRAQLGRMEADGLGGGCESHHFLDDMTFVLSA